MAIRFETHCQNVFDVAYQLEDINGHAEHHLNIKASKFCFAIRRGIRGIDLIPGFYSPPPWLGEKMPRWNVGGG